MTAATKLEKVTHLYPDMHATGERVEMHLRATVDGSYFHHDVTVTARQGYSSWKVEVNRPGGISDADDTATHSGLLLLAAVEARALKRMLDEGEIAFPMPDREPVETVEELPVELLNVLEV